MKHLWLLLTALLCSSAVQAMQQLKNFRTRFAQTIHSSNFLKPKPLLASTAVLSVGLLWKQYDAKKQAELDEKLSPLIASCTRCTGNRLLMFSRPSLEDKKQRNLFITFMQLKQASNIQEDVRLMLDYGQQDTGYTMDSKPCVDHQPHTIIVVTPQTAQKKDLVAHELAHIAERHLDKRRLEKMMLETDARLKAQTCLSKDNDDQGCYDAYHKAISVTIPKQIKELGRTQEYEADKIAALTLKSIDAAMKSFGATRDLKSPTGWKLPAENYYGKRDGRDILIENESNLTHPSHANRCRALLALQEQCPDIFKQRENINPALLVP